MRFVVHISIPPERFNKAVLDGSISKKMGQILEDLKPEAAYFCAHEGKRGGFFVVNMKDVSEMARIAEPWFLNFDATVEFLPAMTPDDLMKSGLDQIAKKWS